MKRVVVTGIGALSPLGHDWTTVEARLKARKNAVVRMPEWQKIDGLLTNLAAPCAPFTLDETVFHRKATRSMGRVALLATVASHAALRQAGLLEHPVLKSGKVGVSYGSSSGSPKAIADFSSLIFKGTTQGINAFTYLKMMAHTAPVNLGVYFGLTGRMYTTCSACTSASQGLGYGYEAIRSGAQVAMLAGGAEELDATQAAIFDTLFATSTKNETPALTPSPFDQDRDGLVLGEGACTFVLEELEHARARGATIIAELVGFGTNTDGTHVTQPSATTMA